MHSDETSTGDNPTGGKGLIIRWSQVQAPAAPPALLSNMGEAYTDRSTGRTAATSVYALTFTDNLGAMQGPGLLGDRYELRDVLGFGGMAEVRDGWDTRLQRAVAVKLLHPGMSSQADIRERFKIEACAAAALNHPNIVGVYDFGEHEGTPYIVMERLPGDTLGDQIARGPLTQDLVRLALQSVLAALTVAHGAGMLHRDIKPGNILRSSSGGMKVADFGIVKAPGSVHTTTGQIVGTLAYLSPDRIAGKPAAVTDDLYAAGVVGYEALTGRRPFTQEDIAPLARAILEDQPPPVMLMRPDVDPGLAGVVERAMSKDPGQRFDSADAMWAALTAVGGHSAGSGATPVSAPVRPPTRVLDTPPLPPSATHAIPPVRRRRFSSRTRKVAGGVGVLAAAAIAALAFALDPSSTTQPATPEPVSISTSVPAPVSPSAVVPAVAPAPTPPPVVEQAPPQERGNANGNGNKGNGNGNGNKKPKG